jgi:hypothetical protein
VKLLALAILTLAGWAYLAFGWHRAQQHTQLAVDLLHECVDLAEADHRLMRRIQEASCWRVPWNRVMPRDAELARR